jgi:hypothetical protein
MILWAFIVVKSLVRISVGPECASHWSDDGEEDTGEEVEFRVPLVDKHDVGVFISANNNNNTNTNAKSLHQSQHLTDYDLEQLEDKDEGLEAEGQFVDFGIEEASPNKAPFSVSFFMQLLFDQRVS